MKHKKINFEITNIELKVDSKTITVVSGVANRVGIVDLGGDMSVSGCFTETIKIRPIVPALADHRMSKPIGLAILSEDEAGSLLAKLELNTDVQEAKEKLALIKQFKDAGRPMQMSIGYHAPVTEAQEVDGRVIRLLKQVNVFEVSVVTYGMNQDSDIDGVKRKNAELTVQVGELQAGVKRHEINQRIIKYIGGQKWKN